MRKRTFMVGRSTGKSTLVVFVSLPAVDTAAVPFAGPWTVTAMVSSN